MKLKDVLEKIHTLSPLEKTLPETTVDTLKFGDPEKEVKKIAVCMHADIDVIRKAVEAGIDLIIPHEPVFYCDAETYKDNNIAAAKMQLLENNGIALFRYHDHPHLMVEDMIDCGTIRASGLQGQILPKPYWAVTGFRLDTPMTAREVAARLEKSLDTRHIQIAGAADLPGRNIAFACGTPGHITELLLSPDWDFVVTGEMICQWNVGELAKDAALTGQNKAVLVLGHCVSEAAGMKVFAELLQKKLPELEVAFIPNIPLFSYTE